jgi:hypothetical protein
LFLSIKNGSQRRTHQDTTRRLYRRPKETHLIKGRPFSVVLCIACWDIWKNSWKTINHHHKKGKIEIERMRALTPRGGMDPPSWWGHTCLGFWFLILEHVRFACITLSFFYHISVHMLCILRNHFVLSLYFLLLSWGKIFVDFLWGWQKKHIGRLLFYLGISKPLSLRTSLILPHMLGLDIASYLHSMS